MDQWIWNVEDRIGGLPLKLSARTGQAQAENAYTARITRLSTAVYIVGTPAFLANVMDGDVITKINGIDVTDQASFRQQLAQFSGQPVTFDVVRGTESISIKMTLH